MIDKTMLYFRGERRLERMRLPFDDSSWSLPVGKIICILLSMSDAFYGRIDALVKDVAVYMADHPMLDNADYDVRKTAAERNMPVLRDIIFGHLDRFRDADEAMLARLYVFLPALDSFLSAYLRSDRRLPGLEQLENERKNLPEFSKLFKECIKSGGRTDSELEGWHQWVNFLGVGGEYYFWTIMEDAVYGKYGESYAGLLSEEFYELRKLQQGLRRMVIEHEAVGKASLSQMQGPRLIPATISEELFPKLVRGAYKYGDVYGVVSMSELVRAELSLLDDVNREIKKCKLCGRYFVPYRKDAAYCSESNPAYGGQNCSRLGSRIEYDANHAVLQTEIGRKFQRNYKAFSRWVIKNMEYTEESVSHLYPNDKLPGENDEKREARKRRQAVNSELSICQDVWRKKAREALIQYSNGEIEREECEERIAIPPIYERSPKLAQLREEMKDYLGKSR